MNILPLTSKIYERALEEQLSNHFENVFNPYLSAFAKVSIANRYFVL